MTDQRETLAIIGTGATTIYLLKHLYGQIEKFKFNFNCLKIFEKSAISGMGMPYSPLTTDVYNLANISSEEIPVLNESFADWLHSQSDVFLEKYHLERASISETEVYSRLALGEYFRSQYMHYVELFKNASIKIEEYTSTEIEDIIPEASQLTLKSSEDQNFTCNRVIIATGHVWSENDDPEKRFFASPWPIYKILPQIHSEYNFPIGILGASLSAFDVISSLAHRHGDFINSKGKMVYQPFKDTENFKLIMHDANGWLPHLQYEQEEPMRVIYRHITREQLLGLLDSEGFLRIETFFQNVCKPALKKAFLKDKLTDLAKNIMTPDFKMEDFVEIMSVRHEYENPFEGMKFEMREAKESVFNNKPIHWKEVIDDLMYCLNYHAELMPAEDHRFFQKVVMPFLLNVIAALPLGSAAILLALYEAGKLELRSGFVKFINNPESDGTTVEVTDGDTVNTYEYKMFVCCGGQRKLGIQDYPFPTLVENKWVRAARISFKDEKELDKLSAKEKEMLVRDECGQRYLVGGIDIDASYRLIGGDGIASDQLYDVSFAHCTGIRPYSYGLQACNATTEIMVEMWAKSLENEKDFENPIIEATKLYRDVPDL